MVTFKDSLPKMGYLIALLLGISSFGSALDANNIIQQSIFDQIKILYPPSLDIPQNETAQTDRKQLDRKQLNVELMTKLPIRSQMMEAGLDHVSLLHKTANSANLHRHVLRMNRITG